MPTYDFQCPACLHMFEFRRSMMSTEIPACPKCGHTKTEKLLSPPPVVFKGEGFYKTDGRPKAKESSDAPPATNAEKPASPTPNPNPTASNAANAAKSPPPSPPSNT